MWANLMIVSNNTRSQIQAAEIIRRGGVVAFRTDTFYGLGADPLNPDAVRKVKELKGREEGKPILVLISDMSEVERFIGAPSDIFRSIATSHWPAPLTLVGPARSDLPVDLTAGTNSIGVRLPNDQDVCDFVRACGGALTATSANPSGQSAGITAKQVADYFPEGLDLIVDGGELSVTEPSTVVDLTGAKPRLVREGAIKKEQLKELW